MKEKRRNRQTKERGENLHDTSWQLFRYFPDQLEAAMAVQLLEDSGIPVYKLDGSAGVHLPGIGGTKVFIRACDFGRAEELLPDDGQ